jgi:hypothetical protein
MPREFVFASTPNCCAVCVNLREEKGVRYKFS